MDPYLEGSLWTSVHTQLSAEIARQLAPKLRPKYLAFTTERFVMEMLDGVAVATANVYPDVRVAEAGPGGVRGPEVAIAEAPVRIATAMPVAVPHVTVEIRDTAERQLVTAIEVLSPTNKRGEGYREYLAKRGRLLLSTTHLVEVDLLREGQRVPMQRALPAAAYYVIVSRAENRPVSEVWPIAIGDCLPPVPVPLLPDDDDVPLDLQLALATIYDLLGYDLAVDYSRPPEVPFSTAEAAWADERLRSFRGA